MELGEVQEVVLEPGDNFIGYYGHHTKYHGYRPGEERVYETRRGSLLRGFSVRKTKASD